MKYVQYTKCTTVDDHVGMTPTVLAGIAAVLSLGAAAGGVIAAPFAGVAVLTTIIAYCRWWLYDRLVCLGGERCAIGLVGWVEPPEKKTGLDAFDTDYSINLVLAPHQAQELPPGYIGAPGPPPASEEEARKKFKAAMHSVIANDGIQGELIKEQAVTANEKGIFGKTFPFEGYFTKIASSSVVHHWQPYLHCEFEGGGVYQLYQAAKAALAFAAAAAVACAIPGIGWAVCGILGLIAAIITIAGIVNALNDKGKPSVFDPSTGQTGGTIRTGDDILFVRGDWVFDSAHEGWNELHPLKDCQLVAKARRDKNENIGWNFAIADFMVARGVWQWDGPDPKTRKPIVAPGTPTNQHWREWVESWCRAVKQASSPLTEGNQDRPENKWGTHPVVDGCEAGPAPAPTGPGTHGPPPEGPIVH